MDREFLFFNSASELSKTISSFEHSIIICDENIRHHCLQHLEFDHNIPVICISSGEKNKSLQSLEQIWDGLIRFKAGRHTMVFSMGGGVITDIGGLAASTFKRGIPFTHIPTTLMGMVDASHGGKTGINYKNYKNYIGTFVKPSNVYILPEFLKTLEPIHLYSGFAEMLKHGLIADVYYFNSLKQLDLKEVFVETERLVPFIEQSVKLKNIIVNKDLQDYGLRQILNFGHTFGHAFESFFINEHSAHGYFIAAGIVCESYVSLKRQMLSEDMFGEILETLRKHYKKLAIKPMDVQIITELMVMDKKNLQSGISCVLINGIGNAIYGNIISEDEVKEALNFYLSHA